jgi:hypothetical protein
MKARTILAFVTYVSLYHPHVTNNPSISLLYEWGKHREGELHVDLYILGGNTT